MKKRLIIIAFMICSSPLLYSFCGFYVSKADGTLKNKTSQVILVRDGNRNVITMYNDFAGEVKDFAMVVPVPTILKKSDIHVIDHSLFQRLNDYSAPRLVEYYDENPCNSSVMMEMRSAAGLNKADVKSFGIRRKDLGVKVEAKYLVGEYDILILSARESGGLKEWLSDNGYKIPQNAEEVLEPYIKSNLKFFVVKINQKELKKLAGNFLRPLQISFSSRKFMLPIRLGMANASGDQDLLVYAFTRQGRVECTNYRNVDIATGNKIPLFVRQNFGAFYNNLFTHQWKHENQSVGFLEYAWDISPANYLKCDPCVGNPPGEQDLVQAGVWWLKRNWEDYADDPEDLNYTNRKVYFTRLHFRYNRQHFAQDLSFRVTPNRSSFQARYIITHPAEGDLDCAKGRKYLQELKERRTQELKELATLTGKNMDDWEQAIAAETGERRVGMAGYEYLLPAAERSAENDEYPVTGLLLGSMALLLSAGILRWRGIV